MLRINLIEGDYYHPRVMYHSGKATMTLPIRMIRLDGRIYHTWESIDVHGRSKSSYYELYKVSGVLPSVNN